MNSKNSKMNILISLFFIWSVSSSYVLCSEEKNFSWSSPLILHISSHQNFAPKISARDQSIFFVSNTDSNLNLYKKNLLGGSPKQLSFHPAFDGDGQPSPNGKYLVWISKREDALGDIHLMKLGFSLFHYSQSDKDENALRLARPQSTESNPVWLGNSKEFLFLSKQNQDIYPTLWKSNINDLKAVKILDHPLDSYSVDPSGHHIIFFHQQSIYYLDLTQTTPKPQLLAKSNKWISQPYITEDYKFLYFTMYAYDNNKDQIIDDKDYPSLWRVPFLKNEFYANCKMNWLNCSEPITSPDIEASNAYIFQNKLYFTGNHKQQWLSLQSLPMHGHINIDSLDKEAFLFQLKNLPPGSQRYYLAKKYLALSIQSNQIDSVEWYTKWTHLTDPDFDLEPEINPNYSLTHSIQLIEKTEKNDFYNCFLQNFTAKKFLKQSNYQAAAIFFEQSSQCEDSLINITTQSIDHLIQLGLSESFLRKQSLDSETFISQYLALRKLKKDRPKNIDLVSQASRFKNPELKLNYLNWIYRSSTKKHLDAIYQLVKNFETNELPWYIRQEHTKLLDEILVDLAEYYLGMSERSSSLQIISKLITDNPLHLLARKMQLDLLQNSHQLTNQIQVLKEDANSHPNNTERAFFVVYAEYLNTKDIKDIYLKMDRIKDLHLTAFNLLQRNSQVALYHWLYAKLSVELQHIQTTLVRENSFSAFTFYRGKIIKNFFGIEDQNLMLEAIESSKTAMILSSNVVTQRESKLILADSLYELSSFSDALKEYLELMQNSLASTTTKNSEIALVATKASRSAFMSEEYPLAVSLQKNLISKIDKNSPQDTNKLVKAQERLSLYYHANQEYESSVQSLKNILENTELINTIKSEDKSRIKIILGLNLFMLNKFQACIELLRDETLLQKPYNSAKKKSESPYTLKFHDLELIRLNLLTRSYASIGEYTESLKFNTDTIALYHSILEAGKNKKLTQLYYDLLLSKYQRIKILYKMGDLQTSYHEMNTLKSEAQAKSQELSALKEWKNFEDTIHKVHAYLSFRAIQLDYTQRLTKEQLQTIEELESFRFVEELRQSILSFDKASPSENNTDRIFKIKEKREALLTSTKNLGLLSGVSSAPIECSEKLIEAESQTEVSSRSKNDLIYDLKYCFKKSLPKLLERKNFLDVIKEFIRIQSATSDPSSLDLNSFLHELKPNELLAIDVSTGHSNTLNSFILISKDKQSLYFLPSESDSKHFDKLLKNEKITNPKIAVLQLEDFSNVRDYREIFKNYSNVIFQGKSLDVLIDELQKDDIYFKLAMEKDNQINTQMSQFTCFTSKSNPENNTGLVKKSLTIKMRMLKNVFDFIYACPDKISEVTSYVESIESLDLRPHEPWVEKVLSIIQFELQCLKSECSEESMIHFIEQITTQNLSKDVNLFFTEIASRFLQRNRKLSTSSIQLYQRQTVLTGKSFEEFESTQKWNSDCSLEFIRYEKLEKYLECLQIKRNEFKRLGFKKDWLVLLENEIEWNQDLKRFDLEFLLNSLKIEDAIYFKDSSLAKQPIERNSWLQNKYKFDTLGWSTDTNIKRKKSTLQESTPIFFHPNYFSKLLLVYFLKIETFESNKIQIQELANQILNPSQISNIDGQVNIHRFEIMNYHTTLSYSNGVIDAWDITDANDVKDSTSSERFNPEEFTMKFFKDRQVVSLFYENERLINYIKIPSKVLLIDINSFSQNKKIFSSICINKDDLSHGDEILKMLERRFGNADMKICNSMDQDSLRLRVPSHLTQKQTILVMRSLYPKLRLVKKSSDGYDLGAIRDWIESYEDLNIDSSKRF